MSTATHPQTSFVEEILQGIEVHEFLDIDQLTQHILDSWHIPRAYREDALRVRLKNDLRKHLKRKKDSNGMPLWHSVTVEDPDTNERIVRYKQLTLFNRDDFVRVWNYWNRIEKKAGWMKRELEKRYTKRFEGKELTQHWLFDKHEDQEPVVLRPSEIVLPPDTKKLRSKKPR